MSTEARRPFVIGVTGNIACGKSLVLEELRRLGAETIDADRVAHGVMEPGSEAYVGIVAHFGRDVLGEDGGIDRRRLGAIVFRDPAELAALEHIVHPATVAAIERQIRQSSHDVVVVDAIKLIEVGLDRQCDEVWVVRCEPEQQVERLMRRNGFSRDEALTRINAQPPQAEKLARADRVIDNSGSIGETMQQVQAAWSSRAGAGR